MADGRRLIRSLSRFFWGTICPSLFSGIAPFVDRPLLAPASRSSCRAARKRGERGDGRRLRSLGRFCWRTICPSLISTITPFVDRHHLAPASMRSTSIAYLEYEVVVYHSLPRRFSTSAFTVGDAGNNGMRPPRQHYQKCWIRLADRDYPLFGESRGRKPP